MPLHDAVDALDFDVNVLGIAIFRLLFTLSCCIIPVIFFASEQGAYSQSSAVSAVLVPDVPNSKTVQFLDINSVDDVYGWLTDTFVPSVFVTTDHNGNALPEYQLGHLDFANKVLGGVVLEMTPKGFEPCSSQSVYVDLYPYCSYVNNAARSVNFLDIKMDSAGATTVINDLKKSSTWVNYLSKQLIVTLVTYSGEVSAFTLSRLKVKFIKSGMIQVTASTNGIPDYREHTWENVAGIVLYYACLGIALQYLENPKRYQIHFGLCKIRKPSRLAFHRMLHRFVVFLAKFGTLYVFPP